MQEQLMKFSKLKWFLLILCLIAIPVTAIILKKRYWDPTHQLIQKWALSVTMERSAHQALLSAANHYLDVLNKIGDPEANYTSDEILPVCANDCKKIRNGKLLFEGKEFFAAQLNGGKEWLGGWLIEPLEVMVSAEDHAAIIRYKLLTEKEDALLVFVILRFDPNYLIREINEVHNKLEI